MSTTSRQNNLILNQDWTRIYQTFRNADFKSYDFENIRRVIISYLRENYPEDFNDYIESSEYMALVDAVAFLGQSISFRLDLASRENFLELAERKESVLRIARMLSYNAKRNIGATGLLKFNSISTSENIIDSNGRNLAQQTVKWNDPTNTNWAEQFILVLNAAMADNTEFGRSQGAANIQGIPTEQYRFRTTSNDVPLFNFTKSVAGRNMAFEIVSTTFKDQEIVYEEAPTPGNQLGFLYRQDGKGSASANTGFFLQFKQGSLEFADFSIDTPTTNETIAIETDNINNDDLWLFGLNSLGGQEQEWTKVNNLTGNNIAYNSIVGNIKNIFSVSTQPNDKVNLVFADGTYGNLPQGSFRTYYRVSNGLEYSIAPNDMKGISIDINYVNKSGIAHTLTVNLGLQYTVNNAAATESTDTIRQNAPALYYTQNRMVTGEDYNLAPLASSQNILKIKAVNRTSSGISRNYDIVDASGKYSAVNVFADDGYIYKQESERSLFLKFTSKTEIINFLRNNIEGAFTDKDLYNFYITKYERVAFSEQTTVWTSITNDLNSGTGYFTNTIDNSLLKVGTYSTSSLKFLTVGSAIKFTAPDGYHFMTNQNNKLMMGEPDHTGSSKYVWAKVQSIVGDGTNADRGALANGLGPITFNENIPEGAIATAIVPKFVNDLDVALETEITNLMFANLNFGLRYDTADTSWKIIQNQNLDLVNNFSLGKAGDTTSENLDASWLFAFVKDNDQYVIRIRTLNYIFGSVQQNRFYFDKNEIAYNNLTGRIAKDTVNVLGINSQTNSSTALGRDYKFEITDTIEFDDGYESAKEIKLSFSDTDNDGVVDDPDSFIQVAGADVEANYLFFVKTIDEYGTNILNLFDNTNDAIIIRNKESDVNVNDFDNNQLIYFSDVAEDVVKRVNKTTNTLDLDSSYVAYVGRRNLKFQYTHSASENRRIDPSVTNIVDLYLLTKNYDIAYRNYLAGATAEPVAPTTDSLRIEFGANLNAIKTISDEVIYHPVQYKVLFGSKAPTKLQAEFKVVKNPDKAINDNNLKVRIVNAINTFFGIQNWDFGDRFYLSELTTYVINTVSPDVTNFVILPRSSAQSFGSLFEIQSKPDEIFVSGATVDDIKIVTSITAAEIRASTGTIESDSQSNTTSSSTTGATSSSSSSSTTSTTSSSSASSSTSSSTTTSTSGSSSGGSSY